MVFIVSRILLYSKKMRLYQLGQKMELEVIMLSEIRREGKLPYCLTLVWNIMD